MSSNSPKQRLTLFWAKICKQFGKLIERLGQFGATKITANQQMAFLAILIGIGAGLMALVLKNAVHYLEQFISALGQFPAVGTIEPGKLVNYLLAGLPLLVTPALGIFLTILLVRYAIKDDISHGVTKVLRTISIGKGDMPRHSVWSYVAACSLTAGFGGSVGMEAPILATGSGIGSNVARLFNLPYRHKVVLIGCGAAAAVAAIFKAPIAGLIIALEVLAIDSTAWAIMPILLASVSAALVSIGFSSSAIEFYFTIHQDFKPSNIPWYIALGVVCGLVAVLFSRVSWAIERLFKPMRLAKRFIIGAGLVGILVFMFPPLFGEGYDSMKALLSGRPELLSANPLYGAFLSPHGQGVSGWLTVLFLLTVLVLKIFATPLTNAAGGVGGIFAPSLFIGCLAGTTLAKAVNVSGLPGMLGLNPAPEQNMALVGMAGMLSGVMHAPLTAIFLIAEITGGYGLFIPLIICSAIAFYTIKRFEKYSVYTTKLASEGQLLTQEKDRSALNLLRIDEFIRHDAPVVNPATTLAKIVPLIAETHSDIIIVTEGDNYRGLIQISSIRSILFVQESYNLASAHDLMVPSDIALRPKMPMDQVLAAFSVNAGQQDFENGLAKNYLPVVSNEGQYLGFVSHSDVLEAYRRKMLEISSYSD